MHKELQCVKVLMTLKLVVKFAVVDVSLGDKKEQDVLVKVQSMLHRFRHFHFLCLPVPDKRCDSLFHFCL